MTASKRGRTVDPVATSVTRLNRKLRTALEGAAPARARAASRSKAIRPRGGGKRLEALAKARAARAAKKTAAEAS